MSSTKHVITLLAGASLLSTVRAQTSTPEIEPNGTKPEATIAAGLVAGDTLTGTSTGTSETPGLATDASAVTWRVMTAALPFGIYRHTLALTTSGTAGHTGAIRGLTQSSGVIGTIDVAFQTSFATSLVPRSNTWYGFGKQEEIYYRVKGTAATTSPYTATLSTIPVAPIVVAGSFQAGQITVSTVGETPVDTELYVYDAALNPVPLGHNDGYSPLDSAPSFVLLTLPAGTYYVAVSVYNTANNQSDLNPLDYWDGENVLDFADAMATSFGGMGANVSFAVSDGVTTTHVPVTTTAPFDIMWARFEVASPTISYCFGNGSGTACPCGNAGLNGHGCANSVNGTGATVAGSGLASLASDTFVLTGGGMPDASALYFQGTSQANGGAGVVFGDGLRCAAGSVIRLGTKTNASGASSYPAGADVPISVKGANSAGDVRDYQIWYRNAAAFCTASTFNLTNGVQVTWGP